VARNFSLLPPGDDISIGDVTQRADKGKVSQVKRKLSNWNVFPHPALRATFSRREKEKPDTPSRTQGFRMSSDNLDSLRLTPNFCAESRNKRKSGR